MQITLSTEQSAWLREACNLLLIPVVQWILKRAKESFSKTIDEIMCKRSDELKYEIKEYVDAKFKEHEDNAFSRITTLEGKINEFNNGKNVR